MSLRKKIALGILFLLVVIVIAAVILVPIFVDANRYRPQIAERIRFETGMPAEIGRLTLTLFPALAIRVDDFALSNAAGFPQGYLVTAKRIDVAVDARALWNRQIVIKSIELEEPDINLLQRRDGQWNFQARQGSGTIKKASLVEAPTFSLGLISKLTISHGKITAANFSPSGKPDLPFLDAQGFSCQMEQVNLNAFGAHVSKSLAPPVGREFMRALWGRPAIVYAAELEATPAAQGKFKAEALRFQTFNFKSVISKMRLYPKKIFFDDFGFDLYEGHAQGDVNFNFAGINPQYSVKAQVTALDVARLLAELPGSKVWMTGKAQGNMILDGEVTHSPDPFASMHGTGRLSVRDGNLPMVQLDKNVLELARLSNLGAAKGDPRSFSSIVADFDMVNDRISSRKIIVVGNGLSAEGSGSLGLAGNGSLDYHGVASILAGTNQLTNLIVGFSGATLSHGRMILPFAISGTLKAPKFITKQGFAGQFGNVGNNAPGKVWPGMNLPSAQPQRQNPASLIQGLANAFKKKKAQ